MKVMSLNMWFGKYIDDLEAFVEDRKPDVILLQEVPEGIGGVTHEGAIDSYQRLIRRFGYEGVFHPQWDIVGQMDRYRLGVAILTKFPIVRSYGEYYFRGFRTYVVAEPDVSKFPGVLLGVEVETKVGILRFFTTHFIWSMHPEITDYQMRAVQNLRNVLRRYDSFVIGGDFNVTDDSTVYKALASDLVDDRPEGLTRSLHPEIHKIKMEKDLAVDYVFHKGTKYERLYSDVPVVPVSDHLPVMVEYEVS